jgi:hypothetical protein
MKSLRPSQNRRKLKTYRALNCRFEEVDDLMAVQNYEASKADSRTRSSDVLIADLRASYVGRFRTKRLRKKYSFLLVPITQIPVLSRKNKY